MSDKEYIYQLVCEGIPVYIGRTTNLTQRLSSHLSEARCGGTSDKCQFIRKATAAGMTISIEILLEVPFGELGDAEDEIISNYYGTRKQLLNNKRGDIASQLSPKQQYELKQNIRSWKKQNKQVKKRKYDITPWGTQEQIEAKYKQLLEEYNETTRDS